MSYERRCTIISRNKNHERKRHADSGLQDNFKVHIDTRSDGASKVLSTN